MKKPIKLVPRPPIRWDKVKKAKKKLADGELDDINRLLNDEDAMRRFMRDLGLDETDEAA